MSTSKTCILFGFSPDPKCLGLCEGLVDEKDLAVDEDNFRRSIRFTLGGIIAEGCDRILADAGCYAPVSYTHLDVYKRQVLYHTPLFVQKNKRPFIGPLTPFCLEHTPQHLLSYNAILNKAYQVYASIPAYPFVVSAP